MRVALPCLGLPFARFSFAETTADLLRATAELMAVEIGSHCYWYGHKKSPRDSSSSFNVTLTTLSTLPRSQKGVVPHNHLCLHIVDHTSPEQLIPLVCRAEI